MERRALLTLLIATATLAGCATRWHPLQVAVDSDDVIGTMQRYTISGEETLLDLTRRYDLGYVELVAANPGVDPWLPESKTKIVLPTAHLVPPGPTEGIVINLAEQRLYFFPSTKKGRWTKTTQGGRKERAGPPFSFPIGVSRQGWATPLGRTRVVRKRRSPVWYPTASARREDPTLPKVVRPGPENPLGEFALYLGWPTYLIHGTNEPDGVGRRVSRGCIRLYPEDIKRLFAMATLDTPVHVVHEPVKLARAGKHIYLEVHPTLDEMSILEEKARLEPIRPKDLRPQIRDFAGDDASRVDWQIAYRTAAERLGIPIRITR